MASIFRSGENVGMDKRKRADLLYRGAGLLTWALISGLALYLVIAGYDGDRAALPQYVVLILTNLVGMQLAMRGSRLGIASRRLLHGVQAVSALLLAWILPLDFSPIYTIIWIALVPALYSTRTSWLLLLLVMASWYVVMGFGWGYQNPWVSVSLYGTFHLFALLSSRTAIEAEEARDKVELLNSELVATQHLLSEASRQNERTRIARDLHDLLGHHMTALTIKLQIAERLSEGDAKTHIAECRALSRLLLADVREAVSAMRDESGVDFRQAINLLVEKIPQLDISLDIEDELEIDDVEIAESLLRCIQEAITNTLRHAGASRSWIRVWREGDSVNLEIHDDGKRGGDLVEGNGLTGMRERIAHLRGTFKLDTVNDALKLSVSIPLAGAA